MESYKAIIIGGGMAGLSAARRLLDKSALAAQDILIVEALDRVGGRILKKTQEVDRSPNHPVDVGACWICPEQKEVWAMTEAQGLTIVAQQIEGMNVNLKTQGGLWDHLLRLFGAIQWKDEERKCGLYSLPAADLIAYTLAGKKLDKLAKETVVDNKSPWNAANAEELDSQTVEEWLAKEIQNIAARGILRSVILAVFCLPTTEYSMLMFLAALRTENFDMFTTGAQSHRVMECNGTLAHNVADGLREDGVKILLDTLVVSCEQQDVGGVNVTIKDAAGSEKKLEGTQVVCTIPPTEYKSIAFKPELPQIGYARDMSMGKCIKTVLAYKEKWWSKSCGFADPDLGHPITLVFDVSHPGEPMLATFFYGEAAVEYSGDEKKEERKTEAIKGAQRLVSDADAPDPRSLEPLSVVEGDWPSTPHIHGAYAGVPKAGAITKHKHHRQTLGESFKRIHFAGTETSEHWAGYIEGAILSGNRVGDVVAKLFE